MGWFDEQLRVRKQQDEDYLESAIEHLVGSVTGKRMGDAFDTSAIDTSVLEAVLHNLGIKAKLDPMPESFSLTEEGVADQDEQMEYRLRPFGVMWRRVDLEDEWYRNATGPLAGRLKEDGTVVALLPNKTYGYSLYNYRTGERIKLNRETDKLLDREAVSFYKPFPLRKISIRDLILFMLSQLTTADIVLYLLSIAVVTAVGTISPLITKLLFSDVLASNSVSVLVAMAVFAIGYCLCQVMLAAFKALVQNRVTTKVSLAVQSATMNRVMQLPASFFKDYAAGDLSQRMNYVQSLCGSLMNSIGNTGLTAVFSLVYIGQIFVFAPSMVIPALGITLVSAVLSTCIALRQVSVTREMMSFGLQESAVSYATISGIQKIKLSGSEKRMFARWLDIYAKGAALQYNPPLFLRLSSVFTTAVSLAGTAILYYVALKNSVSIADYYAFTTAYGMVSGAFMALAGVVTAIATIRPTLEMAKPLLDAEPEISEGKKILNRLGGNIEMSHVSFRYGEDSPWVLDDVSFEVGRGEYVAVVGKTGCGKSTLLRLLLGFETPQKGSIYYDGVQLASIDPKSLRRRIGTVMQDGKLFKGDIYSNIVISAPTLSVDEAWEAAEIAAIADDIRAMPMGMHTVVGEGQGGISGGQRQRLMIARAIAPKPSILMFDEATSALDNLTQRHVSESLDAMKCTRIVIAHRLSTIKHCDRIIVLDGGKIAESGTYEELIEKNGFFADLVARQRIDVQA